jgi:hypothetical protein
MDLETDHPRLPALTSLRFYRLIEEPARRKLNPRRKPQLGRVETELPPQPVPA